MDPDATLGEILELVAKWRCNAGEVTLSTAEGDRLAELVDSLNGWLTAGGFLPSAWHLSTCTAYVSCRGEEVVGQMGGE